MEIFSRPYVGPDRSVFVANGAISGAAITHIVLRVLKASPWNIRGLTLQAGAAFVCSQLYPRIPGVVCEIPRFLPYSIACLFGWRLYSNDPSFRSMAAWIASACIGLIATSYQEWMYEAFLIQQLGGATPDQVRQIVRKTVKFDLLKIYSNVPFTQEPARAFIDEFGSKEGVTPGEVYRVFASFVVKFGESFISEKEINLLSENIREKLKEHMTSGDLDQPIVYGILHNLVVGVLPFRVTEPPVNIKNAVKESPELYGEMIGKLCQSRNDLLSIVKRFGLEGSTINRFGARFMRTIYEVEHRKHSMWGGGNLTVFDRPSKEQLDFMLKMMAEKDCPKGNALIEALSSSLVYEVDQYPAEMAATLTQDQLSATLPRDVLEIVLANCSPDDLIHVSRTCRTLYNRIVTKQGARIWKAKNLGSLDAVRNIVLLSMDPKLHPNIKKALWLAAPPCINLNYFKDEEEKEWNIVRRLRDEPNNTLNFLEIINSGALECLFEFGLPWNAIQPFIDKMVAAKQLVLALDELELIEDLLDDRITKDHPHYDIEPFNRAMSE